MDSSVLMHVAMVWHARTLKGVTLMNRSLMKFDALLKQLGTTEFVLKSVVNERNAIDVVSVIKSFYSIEFVFNCKCS